MKKFTNIVITLFTITVVLLMLAACEKADESELIYSVTDKEKVFDAGTKDNVKADAPYKQVIMYFSQIEYIDGKIDESYTFEIIGSNGSIAASGTIAGKAGKESILDNGHLRWDKDIYLKFDNTKSPVDITKDLEGEESDYPGTLKCTNNSYCDYLKFPDNTYGEFFDQSEDHD